MARWCFLACFICTSCLVAGQSNTKYALKGQEVSLKPDIIEQPDGILWKHNGNKVVEFNGQEEHVFNAYENRITLDWYSAELSITKLRYEDSGEYELEAELNKGLHRSLQLLQVIDKVAEPTITCEVNDDSSLNVSAKLACSAESRHRQSLMKFEWRSHGKVQPGQQLTIPLGNKHDDEEYICNVSNPLSSETAIFTAKDCHPVSSSSMPLIVGICVALGILGLVLIVLTLYFKQQRKVCFADPEKQSQPGTKDVSGAAKPLLHRESTLASKQPLRQLNSNAMDMGIEEGHVQKAKRKLAGLENGTDEHMENAAPLSPTHSESPPHLDMNLARNEKSDEDEEPTEEVPKYDPPDPEEANEADPPTAVSDDVKGDTQSDVEVPTSPQKTDEHVRAAAPPSPPARIYKSDVEEEELIKPAEEVPKKDPSDPEEANEADPPTAVSDDVKKDTQSDLEVPTSPQRTGHVRRAKNKLTGLENETDDHKKTPAPPSPPSSESTPSDINSVARVDKSDLEVLTSPQQTEPEERERNVEDKEAEKADEDKETDDDDKKEESGEDEKAKSAPPNAESSAALPHSPLTKSVPKVAPKDTVGENKEDAKSDQVTEETAEEAVKESDSSVGEEKNESDEFNEDKPSTVPEEKSSETTQHPQNSNSTQTKEDIQPETVKPVSNDENETVMGEELVEPDQEPDLYSENSQQPPKAAPRKPKRSFTDASEATCPNTAHADPDQKEELKTSQEPDDSVGQSS